MTNHDPDVAFGRLLHRAIVAKGLRPTTAVDIDKMLNAVKGEPLSDEKLQRMLRKINGLEPMGTSSVDETACYHGIESQLSETEAELLALHRAQRQPLPPELEAKLKELAKRAAEPPLDEQGEGNGE